MSRKINELPYAITPSGIFRKHIKLTNTRSNLYLYTGSNLLGKEEETVS
jgi:hypothetical protein